MFIWLKVYSGITESRHYLLELQLKKLLFCTPNFVYPYFLFTKFDRQYLSLCKVTISVSSLQCLLFVYSGPFVFHLFSTLRMVSESMPITAEFLSHSTEVSIIILLVPTDQLELTTKPSNNVNMGLI